MSIIRKVKEKLYFLKRWYLMVFTYPRETIVIQNSLDYDEYWKVKSSASAERIRAITQNEKWRAQYVARTIGHDPVTIGDIASGPGVIFNYLKEHLTLKEYVGYDSSAYALQVATSLGMKGVQFDITRDDDLQGILPADYFLLLEILEHVPHSEKVLRCAYDKAHKGVFFSFPNSGNFLYRLRLLFGRMPAQWVSFPNEHLRFWTLTDLKWWLRAQGYTNYHIYCYRGIPGLQRIWPALFCGSFVVYLRK